MAILRWLLVIPVAVAGWYIGLFTGLAIHRLNEWLCPARYLVSGMCHAPWSAVVLKLAYVSGSVIAACLVVLLPALTAPSHRRAVAWAAFLGGLGMTIKVLSGLAALAGLQAIQTYRLPAGAAVLTGGLTLAFLVRRHGDGDTA